MLVSFGHTMQANFFKRFRFVEWKAQLHEETLRSNEPFVTHYRASYSEFPDLPIWIAAEVLDAFALGEPGLKNQITATVAARTVTARNRQPFLLDESKHARKERC